MLLKSTKTWYVWYVTFNNVLDWDANHLKMVADFLLQSIKGDLCRELEIWKGDAKYDCWYSRGNRYEFVSYVLYLEAVEGACAMDLTFSQIWAKTRCVDEGTIFFQIMSYM